MAVTTIKSYNSDNQAEVTSDNALKVTGNITASNPSTGPTATPVPLDATLVGGKDPSGNLVPLKVTPDGTLATAGDDSGGFSNISPGYPTQITVGTSSTNLFSANPSRKYAHISNNSSAAIYIQYGVAAAINQGIKIGPGGFFTLDIENLWKGDINAIGLTASQLIDVLEGIL